MGRRVPGFFSHQGPGKDSDSPNSKTHRHPGPSSEGSGFVIQAGGYILTNNHVVAGAAEIKVRLKDGRPFTAKLIGTDEKTDIAVIKIDATDLPVEELADSDTVRVGEIACAIGVPYNQKYSFTAGVVSAKDRQLGVSPDAYEDYIQTDASINPGNSGGPLVDLDGKVIGMNTLINGLNRGLGFAIPSNMLREVGDQTHPRGPRRAAIHRRTDRDAGTRRWKITARSSARVKKGVVINTILADSPAYKSTDLHTADVITEVDGVAVSSDRELQKQILTKRVGTTVQLNGHPQGQNHEGARDHRANCLMTTARNGNAGHRGADATARPSGRRPGVCSGCSCRN